MSFPDPPQLDDPLDAIDVHAFCGAWGLLGTGFFSAQHLVTTAFGTRPDNGGQRDYGVFMGGDGRMFACQVNGNTGSHCFRRFFVVKFEGISAANG